MFLPRFSRGPAALVLLALAVAGLAQAADLAGRFYFVETASETGTELWRVKEDLSGAEVAADIYPGVDSVGRAHSSSPAGLVELNGKLVFSAFHPDSGRELWQFDPAATEPASLLANLHPDVDQDADGTIDVRSSSPANLTRLGTEVYFSANDGTHGVELFRTDGTETLLVDDINAAPLGDAPFPTAGSFPHRLRAAATRLYFVATDGSTGFELWSTTGVGAQQVADIFIGPDNGSSPVPLATDGDALYFSAYTPDLGYELYRTEGTGAALVADLKPGTGSSLPANMVLVDAPLNRLYFTADDGNGRALYALERTAGQAPVLVTLPPDGARGSQAAWLTPFGGTLYFAINDGRRGTELWRISPDGVTAELFANIGTDEGLDDGDATNDVVRSSSPSQLTVVGGQLFFTANDGSTGNELWVTDGSVDANGAGIVTQVKDIVAGTGSSTPERLEAVNGQLFFFANTSGNSTELWVTDGTEANTRLVQTITRSTAPAPRPRGGGNGGAPAPVLLLGLALGALLRRRAGRN